MIEVRLLRPLDGRPVGEMAEYPEEDAKRLERGGVVKIVAKASAPSENKAAKPAKKGA